MEKRIELMQTIEKVTNDALRLALSEKDASHSLEIFIEYVAKFAGCDRMYIFEGERGKCVSNTFEWCAEGVSEEKDSLQDVPYEAVSWWYDVFEKKSSLIIMDLESIKEKEPLTYSFLKPQKIKSLIASPLKSEGTIVGFYGMDNPSVEIMENVSDIAEITGHFIAALLDKQKLVEQLEKLSFEDSLTGVRNRHALNEDIRYNKVLKDVGIIYCDVLGLKKVNDRLGHQAGDALIIRASHCLKKTFRKTDVYRIGGDEFLVICKDVEEEIFKSKVEQLRKDMKENDAVMSLGCLWKKCATDVDAAISKADELMYQEKQAYYAAQKRDTVL